MPKMKALIRHGWREGEVNKGDEFEASEQEARLLRALGWSTDAHAYQTTEMRAAPIEAPRPTRAERRALRRTDMQASQ